MQLRIGRPNCCEIPHPATPELDRLDEFGLIRRFFTRPGRPGDGVETGIGDDAAVIDTAGRIAVAVDTLVETVHFPAGHPPQSVGHRALAVNLSDLAAMGLASRWFTLALTLPAADEDWLASFSDGLFGLADRHGLTLVGGDTTRGPLTVTVQVMGEVGVAAVLQRDGAGDGDEIWISGTLGDAAAVWSGAVPKDAPGLGRRFDFPEPRVATGMALRELASAAIDISDGLVADLGHLCKASGCSAEIDSAMLPLSAALVDAVGEASARDLAMCGGDDYELCLCIPPGHDERIRKIADETGVGLTRIGYCRSKAAGEVLVDGIRPDENSAGHNHF